VIAARVQREAQSLANLRVTESQVTTLAGLHDWFHQEHRCYAVARQDEMLQPQQQTYGMDDKALQSY